MGEGKMTEGRWRMDKGWGVDDTLKEKINEGG
jgi:hypothetical protein